MVDTSEEPHSRLVLFIGHGRPAYAGENRWHTWFEAIKVLKCSQSSSLGPLPSLLWETRSACLEGKGIAGYHSGAYISLVHTCLDHFDLMDLMDGFVRRFKMTMALILRWVPEGDLVEFFGKGIN